MSGYEVPSQGMSFFQSYTTSVFQMSSYSLKAAIFEEWSFQLTYLHK